MSVAYNGGKTLVVDVFTIGEVISLASGGIFIIGIVYAAGVASVKP